MNILEAIEAVKAGKCVKYIEGEKQSKVINYAFQLTIVPLGTKELICIDLEDNESCDNKPLTLSDLDYSPLGKVCVRAILAENFEVVSLEDMLGEIQLAWEKYHSEEEEDDEDED